MSGVLTLYTGNHCPLCDQAKALLYPVLQEKGWRLHEVNINGDETLMVKYGIRIPVIVTPDGREKGWTFSAGQVRRLISGP
jgi:glutaredoxin